MSLHHLDVPTPDGRADALLATPDQGEGPWPAVLVFMDAFGLRPRLEEMAEHLAAQGYVVLVPNLYYREGRTPVVDLPDLKDPENREAIFGALGPLMQALTPERVLADTVAYLDFLGGRDEVAGPEEHGVGVVGYCMGVAHALRAAATEPERIRTVAGFHGAGLATDDPQSPHRLASHVRAEVYLGHAADDANNPPEQQQALTAAFDEAGVTATSEVYDAPHGYSMSDTAAYDEAATQRHWEALTAVLARTLSA